MSDPTLSVTVTNYNYAPFLTQCIESILTQTYEDYELIIIDNASTDQSMDVIREHAARDRRIRVIEHAENQGALRSWQEACNVSRGRYRVHVDADDWIRTPSAFEQQVAVLEDNPTVTICYSPFAIVDSDGRVLHVAHPHTGSTILPAELALEGLLTMQLAHTGPMIRLDAYRATSGYRPEFVHYADMRLAIQMAEQGDVAYIDEPLYAWREHATGLHHSLPLKVLEEEVLPIIDAAFSGPIGSKVPNADAVRRRVEQNALVHYPWQFIFTGHRRAGWRMYWESVKLRPYETVAQRATLHLVARTVLGGTGYAWLEARVDHSGGTDE